MGHPVSCCMVSNKNLVEISGNLANRTVKSKRRSSGWKQQASLNKKRKTVCKEIWDRNLPADFTVLFAKFRLISTKFLLDTIKQLSMIFEKVVKLPKGFNWISFNPSTRFYWKDCFFIQVHVAVYRKLSHKHESPILQDLYWWFQKRYQDIIRLRILCGSIVAAQNVLQKIVCLVFTVGQCTFSKNFIHSLFKEHWSLERNAQEVFCRSIPSKASKKWY